MKIVMTISGGIIGSVKTYSINPDKEMKAEVVKSVMSSKFESKSNVCDDRRVSFKIINEGKISLISFNELDASDEALDLIDDIIEKCNCG